MKTTLVLVLIIVYAHGYPTDNHWAKFEDLTEDEESKNFVYDDDFYENQEHAGTDAPFPIHVTFEATEQDATSEFVMYATEEPTTDGFIDETTILETDSGLFTTGMSKESEFGRNDGEYANTRVPLHG